MSFFQFSGSKKQSSQPPVTDAPVSEPKPETAAKMYELLGKHVPAAAVDYCFKLWKEHPFSFKITRTRSTCFGNYSFRNGQHTITVNHDLNVYAFLLTYIHEIAHQRAWLGKSRKKIAPHGKEWKTSFQGLMLPLLTEQVFHETILVPLAQYMRNPAASSVRYAPLAIALQSFDAVQQNGILLVEVADKQWFTFRNTVFQKLEKRRTRVLCMERNSKRRWTILATARVTLVEE
ncbi:SprT-like domain-containing protein [Emticicia sp. 17c]|uniref:SprT-like domain-containing protein n=1 Tax=Emticicia sp. 17c TaxID=3127704 RepID=UPI00301BFD38